MASPDEKCQVDDAKMRVIKRMLIRGLELEEVAEIAEVPYSQVSEILKLLEEEEPQDVDPTSPASTSVLQPSPSPLSPEASPKEVQEDEDEQVYDHEVRPSTAPAAPAAAPAAPAAPVPPPRPKPDVTAAGNHAYRRRLFRPQTAPAARRAPTAAEVGLNMRRVKLFVFQWKRRAKDFFTDFNLLNSGRCTRDQFLRGLTNLLHPRSLEDAENPIDAEVLMDFFEAFPRLSGQPRLVDLRRFCEEVELVFGLHHLEKTPLRAVPEPGQGVWTGFQPRPPSDPDAYEKLLQRIRVRCQARGINLSTCLDDTYWSSLDAKAGRLRPEHFLRTFPLTRTTPTAAAAFSLEEMQPVMERFTDVDGFFRIFLFQKEVEDLVHGFETAPQPPLASTSVGFPLQRYRRPQSARVHSSYKKEGAEDDSQATDLRRPMRPQTARESRPSPTHTCVGQPRPDLMTTLRSYVLTKRVRLWDSFQDFDRLRRGVVSQIGFTNGLNIMGLRLSLQEMHELYQRYKTVDGHFCYHDFCMDLDQSVRTQIEKNLAAAGVKEEKSLHVPLSDQDEKILQKVQSAMARSVKARGLDTIAIFENYKKPGQAAYGHVLQRSFWRAMHEINVKSLAEYDLMVLCKAYCDTDSGKEFNYLNFCAVVDPMNSRMPGLLQKRNVLKQRRWSARSAGERSKSARAKIMRLYNRPITMVG